MTRMEEIEYKLSQNNSVSIVQAISKLVELIKVKKSTPNTDKSAKNDSDLSFAELQLLKSKCGVENSIVSITASHGIVSLVEDCILPTGSTLSDLMVILSTAKCYTGITMAIGNILLLDLRRTLDVNRNYKCPFSIQKPQHPLISLLIQNSEIWLEIFTQIQMFMNHHDDKIATSGLELLRPVFFYTMCDPKQKLRDTSRRQLWNFLLLDSKPQTRECYYEILTWLQTNSKQKCLELCDYLTELFLIASKNNDTDLLPSLVILLTAVTHKLVKCGCDPKPCIAIVTEMLNTAGLASTQSVILMMLADTITICPSVYLKEVLELCKIIVFKKLSNILAVESIVASILQWLLYPSKLIADALKLANDIMLFVKNNHTYGSLTGHLFRNTYFKYIQHADPTIDLTVKLCLMTEKWHTDEKQLLNWLMQMSKTQSPFLSQLFSFVAAIFVHEYDQPEIGLITLEILLKMVDMSKQLAPKMLVLILYKLSDEKDPKTQVALLKALPAMAILKQNIPLIINTLETVKGGPGCLKTLSLNLYFRLWSTEVRCYPYLQKLLVEPELDLEFNISKAHVLKEICEQRPELHGKEMVYYLSQVLNKHGDQKGSVVSALAIEGITRLCEAGVVDIISTWKSLSPRLSKDKRPVVVKSYCEFLSEFSNLRSTSIEQQNAITDVINKLWQYITISDSVEIINAALKSMACFNVEQITLKQLPARYRQNLKLPKEYAKTPIDAARKPENVLPYIPGICWVQMLQNINHDALEEAGNLLIKWTRSEIATFDRGIYSLTGSKIEPANYDYLPNKSIVRGLANSLRLATVSQSQTEFHEFAICQCLRVLGEQYSKPLPPVNWVFLQELLHLSPEIARFTINLACKLVLISGSARRLMENFISSFQPNMEKSYEMVVLFTNLNYLCKGIAPNTLRPMLNKSLNCAYQYALKNDSYDLYNTLAENIKKTLLVEDIHDANRILISQIIETFAEELDANSKAFDTFVPCIVETSTKYIERLSSPSVWWETTSDKLEKAVKIRCALAKRTNTTPFAYLNECINSVAVVPSVQIYTLKHILEIFRFYAKHISISDWLLELMGQIQEKLANKCKDPEEIIFLCDVFLIAVITFAGHDCLYSPMEMVAVTKEARLSLFPNALYTLIHDRLSTITVQVMEWLYHMSGICTEIPSSYQLAFCQSLTMLRHEKSFSEPAKWMKYVSVKRPIC
ncbi:uncharacterized protein CBL_03985 [Carabus blaptoides fortunei]